MACSVTSSDGFGVVFASLGFGTEHTKGNPEVGGNASIMAVVDDVFGLDESHPSIFWKGLTDMAGNVSSIGLQSSAVVCIRDNQSPA